MLEEKRYVAQIYLAALSRLLPALALALLAFAGSVMALHPKDFTSPEEEQRFQTLAKELRCVMCQNEPLSDSPAGVADAMRYELLDLIREGKSDAEITEHFRARYGDFILYRPRMTPVTWILWFGPALLLAGGILAVVIAVRRQSRGAPAATPNEDRQEW